MLCLDRDVQINGTVFKWSMLGTSGVVPELAPWQECSITGSYCSLFWVAVLLPDGELVLCSVLCSIPIYSFFCDERGFLFYCSAEWEESIPVRKFFLQSATGVLYLSWIRSHRSPLSILLCIQSICSWIQSCLALRGEYLGHGTLVGSAKGNLVVQGERQKKPLLCACSVFQTEQEHPLVLLHICPLPVLAHSYFSFHICGREVLLFGYLEDYWDVVNWFFYLVS